MKKCKGCDSEIAIKAKKCPHCGTEQRIWFERYLILNILLAVFALAAIAYQWGGPLIRPISYAVAYKGVHVCVAQHFDQETSRCTQDDSVITSSQTAGTFVSFTGPNGGAFTDAHSTISLSYDCPGCSGPDDAGWQLTLDTPLGSHVVAVRLSQLGRGGEPMVAPPGEVVWIAVYSGQRDVPIAQLDGAMGTATVMVSN